MRNPVLAGLLLLLLGGAALADPRLDQLGKTAARVRGLSYRPISSQVVSQKEAADYVLRLLDAELEPRRTRTREEFLRSAGLMAQGDSLRGILKKLYASQVRGLYDPGKKRYIVVRGAESQPAEAAVAALGLNATDLFAVHELGHAIQDQHFDLGGVDKKVRENFDRAVAAQTLIEGDANVVMMDYAMAQLGLDSSALDLSGSGMGIDFEPFMEYDPNLASAPPFFRDYLTFPYSQGMSFVAALRGQGGWKKVDGAFRSLPASTEEVLHPDKYLKKNDPPKPVKLTLAKQIGKYQALGEDTAGEFTISAWEKQFIPERTYRGSSGWGGDRYRVYVSGDHAFVVWSTLWDTPRDASEFEGMATAILKQLKTSKPQKQGHRLFFSRGSRVTILARKAARVDLVLDLPATMAGQVTPVLP
ncbi:MAG: hypothetical protein HY319_11950 [Armatimonadetes bacterium]|nr:hypothetical protein [Armatimonadota bacterium]